MNPLLNELLSPRHLEYLTLDKNLIILEKSQSLQRFADCPDQVMEGKDVRLAFPEFIGIEDILIDLLEGKRESFCLPGIDRSVDIESQLYFNFYAIGNLDEDDFQDRVIILFEEVTERMILQQKLVQSRNEAILLANALKNSEDYLEKVIGSMAEALLVTNEFGQIKRINKTAEKLFGYHKEELIDRSIHSIINIERFLAERGQPSEFKDLELICHKKTGETIILAFSCSPLFTDLRVSKEFVYIGRDISDRKQNEAELRRSEAKFRELAQQEQLQGRLVKDIRNSLELKIILQTTVTAIKNQFQISRCRFFWYRKDVDPAYFELMHEDSSLELDYQDSHNLFQKVPDLGAKLLQEEWIQIDNILTSDRLTEKNKNYLNNLGYSSLLAVAIKTKAQQVGVLTCENFGKPRHWKDNEVHLLQNVANQLAIAIDQSVLYTQSRFSAMTSKIQTEKLEKALADLQKAQAQLIQSEKMSSLGQLVAGIAHEINNPVSFIYGNIEHAQAYFKDLIGLIELYQETFPEPPSVLQDQLEEMEIEFLVEDVTKILNSMKMGAERIRQIVLSLRNFSRLDESEKKIANIHHGLDSTLLVLNHRLSERIQVSKEYGKLPLIECYPAEINQLFLNLLSNAIDALNAMSNNHKQIVIITKHLDRNYICIKIRDNGLGIPSHQQDKLFDPFFTTKQPGKGTGLGLTVCYSIVEKHGGTIEVSSQEGEGTEFAIVLPIKSLKNP